MVKSLPNILVISFKRFEFDYETMLKSKLNKYFEFPFQLNMKDYMMESHTEECTEYDLTGIVIHNGVSEFGHYYDLIKGPDNKWYKFNDENITNFKEEDIPNEAFGNKDCDDDDSEKERGNNKRNAYILFYTKKCNNKKEELEKYDLSLPPYTKESNIKKEIREEINLKLYKSWIIKNIFAPWYQNLVLSLFKINYDININKEKNYIMINYEEKKEENNNNDIIGEDDMDNKLFKFFIRYYFNVVSRISKRVMDKSTFETRDKFQKLMNNYISKDFNKMKYILEEFSNEEVIDEYLAFCPSKADCKFFDDYIMGIMTRFYQNSDMNDENCFLYLSVNSWLSYIGKNITQRNINKVNDVIINIIKLNSSLFLNYLKEKNINAWIDTVFSNIRINEIYNNVFNEDNLPVIHSDHSILTEKTMEPEENYENLKNRNHEEIRDFLDSQFIASLNDMDNNRNLLLNLKKYI